MNWKVPVERNEEDSRNVKKKQKQKPFLHPISSTENLEKRRESGEEEKGRDRTRQNP